MDDRRPLVGDDLCGLFSHEASPPESDSDGVLSELFVEPTERWHLRRVQFAWPQQFRSEMFRRNEDMAHIWDQIGTREAAARAPYSATRAASIIGDAPEILRTAMATALRWPTSITRRVQRVMSV
jgi:hypothetical protein